MIVEQDNLRILYIQVRDDVALGILYGVGHVGIVIVIVLCLTVHFGIGECYLDGGTVDILQFEGWHGIVLQCAERINLQRLTDIVSGRGCHLSRHVEDFQIPFAIGIGLGTAALGIETVDGLTDGKQCSLEGCAGFHVLHSSLDLAFADRL